MEKKSRVVIIAATIIVAFAVAAAIILPPYFEEEVIEPMPMPIPYVTLDELQANIDILEAIRAENKDEFSWRDNYRLGIAYLHSNKPKEAIAVLKEARDGYPSFYKTDEAIGMAHYRLDELKEAIESWERALLLNPQAEHLESMVERTKRKRGMSRRIETLESELERTDIIDKNNPPWLKRLELASLYLVDKRVEDIVTVLNEALKEKDDSSEIYDMLARAYAMSGDFDSAVRAEESAIKYYKANDTVEGDRAEANEDELEGMKQRLSEMKRIAKAESGGGFHSAPLK